VSRSTSTAPTGKLYRAIVRRPGVYYPDGVNPETREYVAAFGPYSRKQDAWAAVKREGRYMRPDAKWTVEVTETDWRPAPL
jgi:hypothetical protein